jgi:hypothetical protein
MESHAAADQDEAAMIERGAPVELLEDQAQREPELRQGDDGGAAHSLGHRRHRGGPLGTGRRSR